MAGSSNTHSSGINDIRLGKQGEVYDPVSRRWQNSKWKSQWDRPGARANVTGDTFGGLKPPKEGSWDFAGMVRRPTPQQGPFGEDISQDWSGSSSARPSRDSELMPMWKRRTETPAAPGSYAASATPQAPSENLLARQSALQRAATYATEAQQRAEGSGASQDSSSSSAGGGVPRVPSFEDMRRTGVAYNQAADAARNLQNAYVNSAIGEIGQAQTQLIGSIDPSKMKITEEESWATQLKKLKQIQKLIS